MRKAWIGLALAIMGMAAMAAEPAATGGDEHVLVLGRISDNPKAHYEQLKPLLDYVVPRMRDVGITSGRILMARDPQQMTSYLRRSRVDWVTETSGNAMLLQQRAGAEPLLLTERNGVSRYHSIFFARRDSGIDALAGLKGRSIAFQSVASTSAYLVPAGALLDAGLRPEILLSPRDRPAPDTVGYVFARSEQNIAAWVHKRMVDAGVVSSLDWADPRRMPAAFRQDLQIISETPDYPRALEMVRSDLQPKVRERLRQVLLQAANDPVARPALQRFFGTTRFLPLDAETRQALERLRADTRRVREQLE